MKRIASGWKKERIKKSFALFTLKENYNWKSFTAFELKINYILIIAYISKTFLKTFTLLHFFNYFLLLSFYCKHLWDLTLIRFFTTWIDCNKNKFNARNLHCIMEFACGFKKSSISTGSAENLLPIKFVVIIKKHFY